MTTGLTC